MSMAERPVVLVTGAGGFVGQALCTALKTTGYRVRSAVRSLTTPPPANDWQQVVVGNIGANTEWMPAVQGVDAVIHLAARVHVMKERAADPLAAFRAVNTIGTERLARSAQAAGVKRFIYVSSIKVNGEATVNQPFRESDTPAPVDPYAISKWEAEQRLADLAVVGTMQTVVVRPPLVYGPGVRGNFRSMMRVLQKGWPLPLASCHNRRSLVGLANLTDLLVRCVEHPGAAGQVFLAADREEFSTPELLRRTAIAMEVPARLFPFPVSVLRGVAAACGRGGAVERLCGSLSIDSTKAREILGWSGVMTADQELARTARHFLMTQK